MSDYNPMLTEKGTVDRAIEIEYRMEEIIKQMAYLEHIEFEASLFGDRTTWYADKLEELASELSDLQEEYRG